MVNRLNNPNIQYLANPVTGAPLAGGTIGFYASGTSTLQSIYSDPGLTISRTNPIIADSNGYIGDVWLSDVAYKVVLTDSTGVQIWTADPVYSSDFSAFANVKVVNGSPNGQLAGTAGTVGVLPGSSMAFDFVNQILYVATTTGSTTTTVWTAINQATAAQSIPPPTGYLTLQSGTPIINADQVGATAVIYTPFTGNVVPISNGTSFALVAFNEISLSLSAQHLANTLYDVFVFSNAGVVTLCTGPAWGTITPGACDRGSGSGSTQISRLNGLWANSVILAGRNGTDTFTIPAFAATYLGTIWIDGTAGQVTCHRTFGQNRKWGVWNAWNRQPLFLKAGDTGTAWTYNTNTIRASNNLPATYAANTYNVNTIATPVNGLTTLMGLDESMVSVSFVQNVTGSTGSALRPSIGIGLNSATVITGTRAAAYTGGGGGQQISVSAYYTYLDTTSIGINNFQCLENGSVTGGTFGATETDMTLRAEWQG